MSDPLDGMAGEARSKARRAAMPDDLVPMLVTLADHPFSDKGWLDQRKLGGERCGMIGTRGPAGFGASLLGIYKENPSRHAGRGGTGFDDTLLVDLADELTDREGGEPCFDRGPLPRKGVHWVRPDLVCEVGFTEWTSAGRQRHPRLLCLRRVKAAREVVREDA